MASEEGEKMTTTIEIEKDLFLKFKALCVLNEKTLSGEIESLIKDRVEKLSKRADNAIVNSME